MNNSAPRDSAALTGRIRELSEAAHIELIERFGHAGSGPQFKETLDRTSDLIAALRYYREAISPRYTDELLERGLAFKPAWFIPDFIAHLKRLPASPDTSQAVAILSHTADATGAGVFVVMARMVLNPIFTDALAASRAPNASSIRGRARTRVQIAAIAAALLIAVIVVAAINRDHNESSARSTPQSEPIDQFSPPVQSTESTQGVDSTPADGHINVSGPLHDIFAHAVRGDDNAYKGAHETLAFSSKTGNIYCLMINQDRGTGVSCTIGRYEFDEPGPNCPNGAIVRVDSRGRPSFDRCAKELYVGVVLPYNHTLVNGGFACLDAFDGVTCVRVDSGTGFTLSRQQFRKFS